MINNMTFTRVAKKWWVCWQVTFRRAAREAEDDGREEGWTRGGWHRENGGGSGWHTEFGFWIIVLLSAAQNR
jgi:hypothetical protein